MSQDLAVLNQKLTNLESLMQANFDGVNSRLDRLNGSVGHHEIALAVHASEIKQATGDIRALSNVAESLKGWRANQKGFATAIQIIGAALVGAATIVGAYFAVLRAMSQALHPQ